MKRFSYIAILLIIISVSANASTSNLNVSKGLNNTQKPTQLARLDKNPTEKFESSQTEFKVLSAKDIATYKKLFKYQRDLNRDEVAKLIPELEDRILYGHLWAERLLHPKTKSSYSDLKGFLDQYNDQFQAKTIYDLANSRKPKSENHSKPVEQTKSIAKYTNPDDGLQRPTDKNAQYTTERKRLISKVKYYLKKDQYLNAERLLDSNKNRQIMGDSTYSEYALRLTKNLFNEKRYKESYRVAQKIGTLVKPMVHEAVWFEGLSAYHLKKYTSAASTFRRLASNVPAGSKYYSQSSYWAGLSYEKANKKSMSKVYFRQAAKNPYTYYGMISNQKLGNKVEMDWKEPDASKREVRTLLQNTKIRRVIALAEIGEYDLAQKELRAVYSDIPYGMDEALLKMSLDLNLSWNALTLGHNLLERNNRFLTGLYPDINVWKPKRATVDYSLINAIIRQESAFNPSVKSSAGAMGLMQIMPGTADHIRHQQGKRALPASYVYRPDINVKLGQYYIGYLLEEFNGNIIYAIAAYNAGPGNVKKWIDNGLGDNGPTAFVEAIPFPETKKYVKRVMSNYWVYRNKFDQSLSTLRQVADNYWPKDTHSLAFRLK